MKKIILALFSFSLLTIIFQLNKDVLSYTSGAPAGYTNAPGETTCSSNNGACHGLFPKSNPGGTTLLTMEDVSQGYIPGNTYNIMPFVNEDGSVKIGFQTVALLSNGLSAGVVTITNSKTQMNPVNGKEYVTHSASGTTNILQMDWMYEWTAPPSGSGTVTVYGVFLASNNDMTASGDSIYTDSLVIVENTTAVYPPRKKNMIFDLFPSITNDFVTVVYYSEKIFTGEILIYDINAVMVGKRKHQMALGKNFFQIDFGGFPSGMYFVVSCFENKLELRKVIRG